MKNGKKITSATATAEADQKFDQAVKEAKKMLRTPPTRDEVRRWLEHDIQSAIYSLSMISQFPALLDKMTEEMYKQAQLTADQKMAENATNVLTEDELAELAKTPNPRTHA